MYKVIHFIMGFSCICIIILVPYSSLSPLACWILLALPYWSSSSLWLVILLLSCHVLRYSSPCTPKLSVTRVRLSLWPVLLCQFHVNSPPLAFQVLEFQAWVSVLRSFTSVDASKPRKGNYLVATGFELSIWKPSPILGLKKSLIW